MTHVCNKNQWRRARSHLDVSCFVSQFANKPIHTVNNARNKIPALARSKAAQVAGVRSVVVLRVHNLPKRAHVAAHDTNSKFGTPFRDGVVSHEVCEALVQPDVVGLLICEVRHVRGPVLEHVVALLFNKEQIYLRFCSFTRSHAAIGGPQGFNFSHVARFCDADAVAGGEAEAEAKAEAEAQAQAQTVAEAVVEAEAEMEAEAEAEAEAVAEFEIKAEAAPAAATETECERLI